jgi:hypothetical protein
VVSGISISWCNWKLDMKREPRVGCALEKDGFLYACRQCCEENGQTRPGIHGLGREEPRSIKNTRFRLPPEGQKTVISTLYFKKDWRPHFKVSLFQG